MPKSDSSCGARALLLGVPSLSASVNRNFAPGGGPLASEVPSVLLTFSASEVCSLFFSKLPSSSEMLDR